MPPPIEVDRDPIWTRPTGAPGRVPNLIQTALHRAARRRAADKAFTQRWNQLGGLPGPAKAPGDGGLVEVGDGFSREYAGGRMYYRFGRPPLLVGGAIGEKYAQMGGPGSWLGWPTFNPPPGETESVQLTKPDEQPFTEGGRVSTFENGAVYWWADTGPIEMGNVSVRYTGLACFSDTSGPGSDEPYVLLGVVPTPPTAASSTRSVIYDEVDGGDSREDDIELYRGLPYGLSLTVTLMEHDTGDPDKYRGAVNEGVDQAAKGVALGVGAIPYVGPYLAPVAKAFLEAAGPEIKDALNRLLGTGDDRIGSVPLVVSAKQMVTLARVTPHNFRGIVWHLDTPLISGDGADYKVYVGIWPV
jgi:hypothetical protein